MALHLRILYAAGPGNVIGTYQFWVKGEDDPSQVSITYSGQFYEVCRSLAAQAYVISSCAQKQFLQDGQYLIEHRPIPLRRASGILYHLGQLWYGLKLVTTAVLWRADVAVVADGTTHWFVLSLLPWLGVKVIPSLHCVLWSKYGSQRKSEKIILRMSRYLFAKQCTAILAVSDDISQQVMQLTDSLSQPIAKFLPTYNRAEFAEVTEPDESRLPFRVLFAGRIEQGKGVFDLLEIAKHFVEVGRQDIIFDICGNGSALESLKIAAKVAKVDSFFVFHGYCHKEQMRKRFDQAHAVIVPTRTDFVEGFNKVVAEGILSGRPVVTSAVCPALTYVQDAIVEVAPNNIDEYTNALLNLLDDHEFYEGKRQSCLMLQEQFYNKSRSWGATLKTILSAI